MVARGNAALLEATRPSQQEMEALKALLSGRRALEIAGPSTCFGTRIYHDVLAPRHAHLAHLVRVPQRPLLTVPRQHRVALGPPRRGW